MKLKGQTRPKGSCQLAGAGPRCALASIFGAGDLSVGKGLQTLEKSMRDSPAGRFFRWLRSQRPDAHEAQPFTEPTAIEVTAAPQALRRSLLPSHLPLMPLSLRAQGGRLRGRRRSRWLDRRLAWCWAEWLAAQFSFFELGCPRKPADYEALGEYHVTGEQACCFDDLFADCLRLVRSRGDARALCQSSSGRGPSRVLDILHELESELKVVSEIRRSDPNLSVTVAKPISASRIEGTLPSTGGQVLPEDHLLEGRAAEFLDINARVLDPGPEPHTIPRGCYMVSPEDEHELRISLLSRGIARLIPETDVARDSSGRLLLAGMFGVWHRKGLRLIFDRRPQNMGESRLF